jgi:hypothetical protein
VSDRVNGSGMMLGTRNVAVRALVQRMARAKSPDAKPRIANSSWRGLPMRHTSVVPRSVARVYSSGGTHG